MSYFRWNAGRKRQGSPTLESQPGAHTGTSRLYIPGYSDSNIIFLNTSTGNDALDGTSIANAKLTYASAATAAGTTKKIRCVNDGIALSTNITKPTEMTRGVSGTISSSTSDPVNTFTQSATPAFTGQSIKSLVWADHLSKYIAVGSGGTIAHSPDGNTFTVATTPSFGSTDIAAVGYSRSLRLLVAVGDTGKIATSTTGIAWTQQTVSGFTDQWYCVTWAAVISKFVAAGQNGQIATSSDGETWELLPVFSAESIFTVSANDTVILLAGGNSFLYRSTDGVNFATTTTTIASTTWVGSTWGSSLGKFVIVSEQGTIYHSADADTFTVATTPSFGGTEIFAVAESCELGRFVAVGLSGKVAYSDAGSAAVWTQAGTPSFGADTIRAIAWSPLVGKFVLGGGSNKAAYSTAYANTVSASIAGFSVQAVVYSGTVTAYNCTMRQPGTTAALSLNACRVTETDSHFSNNSISAMATLFEGNVNYTGTYAAANALDLNLNTIAGTLYIYNGSATNYERMRDNIIENGVTSTYPVTVTSGNIRGTSSDGTIFGQFYTTSDPMFVDTTDYKLQRVLDGYTYDSPMVAASQYYYNAATTQTFRDNGAWSYNESAATYKYQRTFNFTLPATVIGSTIDFIRHNRANLHVAEDGTPDTANTPDSRWEEIVMTFKTLPSDHIDFINWLEEQVDMTCDISLAPSTTATTSITASGATAAGNAVITVTDNSTIDAGDILTIDGNDYTVIYTYSTNKVVLDRITTTALTDTESITVKYDSGFGEYQYVPQLERRLSRWYETDDTYARGLIVRFARKLP